MQYRALNPERVLETLARLIQRIEERFPGAHLSLVARELQQTVGRSVTEAESLGRPYWPLRVAGGAVIALLLAGVLLALWGIRPDAEQVNFVEGVQAVESAVQNVVFLGIAIFFVASMERRHKRRIALSTLHELRSLAHVVDMHQLTKDPERIRSTEPDTASSPTRAMTPQQLGRYLDYCSELLSIISKVAAVYAQYFQDGEVHDAVNDVESLTNGLARKIWQKISLIDHAAGQPRHAAHS